MVKLQFTFLNYSSFANLVRDGEVRFWVYDVETIEKDEEEEEEDENER